MKVIIPLITIGSLMILSGCSNTLGTANGEGAIAIPIESTLIGIGHHVCSKVSLGDGVSDKIIYGTITSFPKIEKEAGSSKGYLLIDGLQPGLYKFSQITCHTRNGWKFDGKNYYTKSIYPESAEIELNKITVADFYIDTLFQRRLNDKQYYLKVHSATQRQQATLSDYLIDNVVIPGWTLKD
jgi:hypothetical protein